MTQHHSQWQPVIPEFLILLDQVHVWRICLDTNTVEVESLFGHLSADEVLRAGRFRFEKDKKRFIAARGFLRRILGHYLQQRPHAVRFEYATNGKPILSSGSHATALRFNLSHSGAFALCAVTLGRNVGVDIERIRYDIDVTQIARQFFSQAEIRSLEGLHDTALHETFFRYWTRKEALLKARGDGLSFPMHRVDVSSINETTFSPVTLPGDEKENTRWHVQDLCAGEDYAAAIAVEGSCYQLICLHYSL